MFVKELKKDNFPDFPKDTNSKIYQKLVYFEVTKGTITHRVVPFWKIDSDKEYNNDTRHSSNNENKFFYLNQWFSNWYRSEIKIDNSDNYMFPTGTSDQTVYTAEPLVFLKASVFTNSTTKAPQNRLDYINAVNRKWTITEGDTNTKHTSSESITKVGDIDNKILSKPSSFNTDYEICNNPSGTDLHKSFAAYSENSKALKKKPCVQFYDSIDTTVGDIIYYTGTKKWDFERNTEPVTPNNYPRY